MTAFDRLAWRCSWIAPAGLGIALGVVLFDAIVTRSGVAIVGWKELAPVLALVAAVVGVLAGLVVRYHIVKAGSFSSVDRRERSQVEGLLHFDMGYARWRTLMRVQHPELRPHDSPEQTSHERDVR